MPTMLQSDRQILEIYDRHVDTVYRVCYSLMKNKTEAEDMVQETFLKLITSGKEFVDARHEKAWLIVTASNLCKDNLKKWWRRHEDIEDYLTIAQETGYADPTILETILKLPHDYKTVVYMYYYEGYTTVEIAHYLHCAEATVRSRLSRARGQLRTMLGGGRK